MPQIEQGNLHQRMGVSTRKLTDMLTVTADRPLSQTKLEAFICPSDPGSHLMNGGRMNSGSGRHFNGLSGIGNAFRVAKSNYVGVCGSGDVARHDGQNPKPDGVLYSNSAIAFRDITDGTSNVFAVGERDFRCAQGAWIGNRNPTGAGPQGTDYTIGRVTWPLNHTDNSNQKCTEGFSSPHSGGGHFLLCDGSTRFITENIDYNAAGPQGDSPRPLNAAEKLTSGTYERLGMRNDGQVVGDF